MIDPYRHGRILYEPDSGGGAVPHRVLLNTKHSPHTYRGGYSKKKI